VISTHSPTSTLSLIPELEPVLARGGLKLVVVTLPPEAEAGRQRIARLILECLGIICCPSVYAPVSTAIANQRPVFVLWQGAGVAMMKVRLGTGYQSGANSSCSSRYPPACIAMRSIAGRQRRRSRIARNGSNADTRPGTGGRP